MTATAAPLARSGPRSCTSRTSLVLSAIVAAAGATAAPDPDALITFTQVHPLLPEVADRPMVELFPDGRAVVFRDRLRRNPGEHTFELGRAELDRLLGLLDAGLDGAASDEALAPGGAGAVVASPSGDELFAVADPTTSLIGVASTLAPVSAVPPPAPGEDIATVVSENESAGFVTLALEQRPAVVADSASAETLRTPLRELEDALVEIYLLPDATSPGDGR